MKFAGIIPARYASTRFPGKPLADIGGKSMVRRVYEQVSMALDTVVVATDNEEIFNHVKEFGEVLMTSADHPSGTDRVNEAAGQLNHHDYIFNIQGDEPFLNPADITSITKMLEKENGEVEIATIAFKIENMTHWKDPNVVKVILNRKSEAMYFSRSPIPYHRNTTGYPCYQHIGLYAFRRDILEEISKLPPSKLERTESLEQLRWLESGYSIKVMETHSKSIGIDTPEDLEAAVAAKLWQTS